MAVRTLPNPYPPTPAVRLPAQSVLPPVQPAHLVRVDPPPGKPQIRRGTTPATDFLRWLLTTASLFPAIDLPGCPLLPWRWNRPVVSHGLHIQHHIIPAQRLLERWKGHIARLPVLLDRQGGRSPRRLPHDDGGHDPAVGIERDGWLSPDSPGAAEDPVELFGADRAESRSYGIRLGFALSSPVVCALIPFVTHTCKWSLLVGAPACLEGDADDRLEPGRRPTHGPPPR
jgi:hypothetical protein